MKNSTTLYKRDKSGNIRIWNIAHDDKSYWTTAGRQDGKLQTTEPTYVVQKNIGKSNETSLAQQVINEVKSKIQYQLDHGYQRDIPDFVKKFEVSLADKYPDRQEKGKLDFPYIGEPKLDGLRCYIQLIDGEIVMKSRNHKEYKSCPHIKSNPIVKRFFETYPEGILDGELYNHELKNDFNKIVSLVKKSKPSEADLAESANLVQYHCFDVCFDASTILGYLSYKDRKDLMRTLKQGLQYEGTEVQIVGEDEHIITNETEAEFWLDYFVSKGYEGLMLKKDVPYFYGRSFDMLKYKKFKDAEYEIVGFEEGKGNLAGIASAVICRVDNGTTFKAGVTGTKGYAKNLLENEQSIVGKLATIKYQELTPLQNGKGGVPRFGKLISIRDYE